MTVPAYGRLDVTLVCFDQSGSKQNGLALQSLNVDVTKVLTAIEGGDSKSTIDLLPLIQPQPNETRNP